MQLLGGQPHVMVDGAARQGTVATLSHWPRSDVPDRLRRDLSAEMVIAALEDGYLDAAGAALATVDHYDQDGVVALAMLLSPRLAAARSEVLVEAARVGDFGVVRDRRAALVAFALASLADPVRSPVVAVRNAARDRLPGLDTCGTVVEYAIEVLEDLTADPAGHEELWRDEAAAFDAATRGVGRWIEVEDLPDHDLAIVRIDPTSDEAASARWLDHVVHPAAINTATPMLRVAMIAGQRMEVRFRYESWVRLSSHHPRSRVDLSRLVPVLDALEPHGTRWHFDGVNATRPVLRTVGHRPSSIGADIFVDHLVDRLVELDSAPPAWDAYASTGDATARFDL